MHVYLSTSPRGDVFSKGTVSSRRDEEAGLPHFVWENITYGNHTDSRAVNYDIKFPQVCCDDLLSSDSLLIYWMISMC